MSLQIEQQETENRELKLTVHVDEARVEDSMRKVAKTYARRLRIPGFRPGKAPFHIVRNWIGKDSLRSEAVNNMTQDIYKEAIEMVDVTPYAPSSLDEIDMEPLVLHLTVPLKPKVDLGEYRSIRIDPPTVKVPDKEVNEAMEAIQEKHVLLEPAYRPCQEGDVVIADLLAMRGQDVLTDREGAELLLDPEVLFPDIPFVENVVGMSAADEKSFEARVEDDRGEELTYTFDVMVHEVKARYIPPLNDDLALEEGFDSLLEMRIDARRMLTEIAQHRADAEYADQIFDKIVEGATVTYSPSVVEAEIDDRIEKIEERYDRQGWRLDDILKSQGKTSETLREEVRSEAETALKRGQVTIALTEIEQITLDEEEIDQLVEKRLGDTDKMSGEAKDQLRDFYSSEQARSWLANDAMALKFTGRLKAIGLGEAPDLPEISEEEE